MNVKLLHTLDSTIIHGWTVSLSPIGIIIWNCRSIGKAFHIKSKWFWSSLLAGVKTPGESFRFLSSYFYWSVCLCWEQLDSHIFSNNSDVTGIRWLLEGKQLNQWINMSLTNNECTLGSLIDVHWKCVRFCLCSHRCAVEFTVTSQV